MFQITSKSLLILVLVLFSMMSNAQNSKLQWKLISYDDLKIKKMQKDGIIVYEDLATGEIDIFKETSKKQFRHTVQKNRKTIIEIDKGPGYYSYKNFENGKRFEIHALSFKKYLLKEYLYNTKMDNWELKSKKTLTNKEMGNQFEDYRPCKESISEGALDRLIKSSDQIINAQLGTSFVAAWVPATHNLHLSSSCEEEYPNGMEGVLNDFGTGVDKGIRCMERIYRQHRNSSDPNVRRRANDFRRMMRRILGNFEPGPGQPFKISCTDESAEGDFQPEDDLLMMASICGQDMIPNRPGVSINMTKFNRNKSFHKEHMSRVFFHEMLHHTGYIHDHDTSTNFDIVERTEQCCFENLGCEDLLNQDHGDALTVRRGTTVTN